jgi:hypothetical protein
MRFPVIYTYSFRVEGEDRLLARTESFRWRLGHYAAFRLAWRVLNRRHPLAEMECKCMSE